MVRSELAIRLVKEFLEAGKRRLAGDTARAATSGEVKDPRRQAQELKTVVAEQALKLRLMSRKMIGKKRISCSTIALLVIQHIRPVIHSGEQPVMLLGLVSRPQGSNPRGYHTSGWSPLSGSCHGPCFGKPSPLVSIMLCKRERTTSEQAFGHLNWNFSACSLKYSMRK